MGKNLNVVQYDVEIWDWRKDTNGGKGTYVADISSIITDGLNFSWTLNDVENLDFSVDLIQFEKKCAAMGKKPYEILIPYAHDIRLRRNGEYILGCQIVETNIDIPNDANATIQVRCTGFLNLFKDRYVTLPISSDGSYTNKTTPAYIAKELIRLSQVFPGPQGIVKNPTGDIDRDNWLTPTGILTSDVSGAFNGQGYIRVTSPTTGWISAGTRLYVPKGSSVRVSLYAKGQPGATFHFIQRQYVNDDSSTSQYGGFSYVKVNGVGSYAPSSQYVTSAHPQVQLSTAWQKYEFTITTQWDTTYLLIEENRTINSSAYDLCVDDVFATYESEDGIRDLNVQVGYYNSASRTAISRAYELENVKDALIELSEIDTAPIEFYFTPDRTFNVGYNGYVGTNRPEIDLSYPGNIESLTITRSASGLYNSVLNIGSGIGNERIEAQAIDRTSALEYGLRETVKTNNNASEYKTLLEEAQGTLADINRPTDLPKVVIRDGSINPGNLKIGDRLYILINNGDEYLSSINRYYRVVEYQVSIDLENVETVTLTVEAW